MDGRLAPALLDAIDLGAGRHSRRHPATTPKFGIAFCLPRDLGIDRARPGSGGEFIPKLFQQEHTVQAMRALSSSGDPNRVARCTFWTSR